MNASFPSRRPGPIAPVAAATALLMAAILWAAGPDPQTRPAPADPAIDRQREICLPAPAAFKTFAAEGVVLWTDAPLDGKGVLAEVTAATEMLEELLPDPSAAPAARPAPLATAPAEAPKPRPVALAVYARRDDYLALWTRVGEHYGGQFAAITTEGYSYRVFCATSYDSAEAFAARRSVLCHEMAHVWLYQRWGLANDSGWLTEGLATAVQLRLHPRAGDRRQFAEWMEAGHMLPLKRLMDQARIEPKDYWQAATLTELLVARHRDKLPEVVRAVREGRSAYRIVTDVLGTDFLTFGRQWAEHVRTGAAATTRPAE